jgi:hypothetical protein
MTGPELDGQQPDALLITGLDRLSPSAYAIVRGGLLAHGLTVREATAEGIVTESDQQAPAPRAPDNGGLAMVAETRTNADAELVPGPLLGLVLSDMQEDAQDVSERANTRSIFSALLRATRVIEQARVEVSSGMVDAGLPGDQELIRRRAALPLRLLEGGPDAELALDLVSLYQTLQIILEHGYDAVTKPSLIEGIRTRRLGYVARVVNSKLKPEIPLPTLAHQEALEPLPPRSSPRALQFDSPYVDRVKTETGERAVASDEMLREFALSMGMEGRQTGHFQKFFEGLGRILGQDMRRWDGPDQQPYWLTDHICFLRIKQASKTANRRPVWGINLPDFIELFYEIEESEEMQARLDVFGFRLRHVVREYLKVVAPPIAEEAGETSGSDVLQ